MSRRTLLLRAAAAGAVAMLSVPPAAADDVADFYKGKTASLYLGYPPSGAYDIYTRLIARYLTKYVPGNPQFIVRYKPGAASLNLVNACSAAKAPISTRWNSTGSAAPITRCRSAASGTASASGRPRILFHGRWCSPPMRRARNRMSILNNLLGTNFKVVAGYPGVNDLTLALERGEADARCGWSWGAVKAAKPEWLRDKKIYIAVQFATKKHPELPDVPLATELARNDKERAALDLILTQQVMGRPFAAPPKVPADRVTALRRAFDQSLKDPELLAEAEKAQLEIAPVDGEALEAMVAHMFQAPQDVIDAARKAIGQK
jgi:hypothetical protein